MGLPSDTLSGRIYANAVSSLGAGERLQVAGLVRDAHKVSVDRAAIETLSSAVSSDPWAFECNLDTIPPAVGPVWYEWADAEGHEGMLITPVPGTPGTVVFLHCRDAQGTAVHPNAVAAFDLERLYEHAWWARTRFSTTKDESLERMMGCVVASVPEGFAAELKMLEAGPGSEEREMRAATAAFPLLLALLVAHAGKGWFDSAWKDGGEKLTLAPPRRKRAWRRLADLFTPRSHPSFLRCVEDGRARATWYRDR